MRREYEKKGVLYCGTKADKSIENVGLLPLQIYTLVIILLVSLV